MAMMGSGIDVRMRMFLKCESTIFKDTDDLTFRASWN
jgi:hypothetical protein